MLDSTGKNAKTIAMWVGIIGVVLLTVAALLCAPEFTLAAAIQIAAVSQLAGNELLAVAAFGEAYPTIGLLALIIGAAFTIDGLYLDQTDSESDSPKSLVVMC